jgi:flagellar biosynthesis/type III secretory pathway protein FliH
MYSEEYIRDLENNRIFHSYGYDEGYKDGYKKGYEDGKKASSDRKEAED